jgi:hypothetical protein
VAHWPFGLVVVAAVVVRVVVVLGYPPVLWFSDSYNYLYDAVTHIPDQVRPNGYPFFLQLLLPLHSDDAIGLVQAAMGVAIGIAIYALLRHRGLPWWGAALPALPVLFDAYELPGRWPGLLHRPGREVTVRPSRPSAPEARGCPRNSSRSLSYPKQAAVSHGDRSSRVSPCPV